MTKDEYFFHGLILGMLCSLIMFPIGGCVGDLRREWLFQKNAVDHGFAEYSQTTGQWQWKPSPDQPKEQSQ